MFYVQFSDFDNWVDVWEDGDVMVFETKEEAEAYCRDHETQFTNYRVGA